MLRFEREENGVYKVEHYEEIKASIAVEMLAGFEEVYTRDDSDAFVHFELFADFKEKGIDSFADLLTLKFYKKVEGKQWKLWI